MKRIWTYSYHPNFFHTELLSNHYPTRVCASFAAWLMGYKNNPLISSIQSPLLLIFSCSSIPVQDNWYSKSFINWAILSGFRYLIFRACYQHLIFARFTLVIKQKKASDLNLIIYFMFFFNLMNLGKLYEYIPVSFFITQKNIIDILNVEQGLMFPPWVVNVIVATW